MPIENLLEPTNDYVFKRIFGYVGNEEITKGLLNAIIENGIIQDVKLDCKEILEQDLKTDKFGILDIRAILDNSVQCNIEMQIVDRKDIENRLLFYWSKLYSKSIKLGERYISAQKTIIILFADYEIRQLEKIHKYFSKWHICEDEYKNIILTENFEIYIIELPKFEKYRDNSKLSTWVKFIRNPEVINMKDINDNEPLKEAKELLKRLSRDEREEELAFQRLMYVMDQKAIEASGYDKGEKIGYDRGRKAGYDKGEKIGFDKGQKAGFNKGQKAEKEKIARALLNKNLDINIIIEVTGLTREEIEKL